MPLSITGKLENVTMEEQDISGPLMSHALATPIFLKTFTISSTTPIDTVVFDMTFPRCIPVGTIPNNFLQHVSTLNGFYDFILYFERIAIPGFTTRLRWYKSFSNLLLNGTPGPNDFFSSPSFESEFSDANTVLEIPVEIPHMNLPLVPLEGVSLTPVFNQPQTSIRAVMLTQPVLTPIHPSSFDINVYVKINIRPVVTGILSRALPLTMV